MREIKFRVWDSISTAYHYWGNIQNNKFNDFDLEHYTLEQFTGLKDKNGVDIYEGDILKHDNLKTTKDVEWVDGCGFECWIDDNNEFDNLMGYMPYILKVIGNIHENK